MRNTLLLSFVILVGGVGRVAYGEVAILSLSPTTSTGSQFDQTIGWRFHLSTAVTLTSLGVYDHLQDGFAEPHEVGLWTTSGALMTSGSLSMGASGNLTGPFRYVDVPDVVLPTGDYVIGAHFRQQLLDPFPDFNSSLTTHPFIEYFGRNGIGPGFQFPSIFLGTDGLNYITSNFQFTTIPESSTLSLFAVSCLIASVYRSRTW
jgi:hypothetical protein